MVILKMGYNLFAVPEAMLPLVAQMVPVKEMDGEFVRTDTEISVIINDKKLVTGDAGLEARIRQLEKDLKDSQSSMLANYNRANELEKQMKANKPA